MTRLTLVPAQYRQQWDSLTVTDQNAIQFLYNVGVISISQNALEFILGEKNWSGYTIDIDGKETIGYGFIKKAIKNPQGMTELESYSIWLADIMTKQKIVRDQLSVIRITQGTFDALVSLYDDTGTWREVKAVEGVYDIQDAVRNGNWLLVADMIQRGKVNSARRRREANMVQLGDYSSKKNRAQQSIQGLQRLLDEYLSNSISNDFRRRQAEFVYYKQLGAFIPGMSESRQRRILSQIS